MTNRNHTLISLLALAVVFVLSCGLANPVSAGVNIVPAPGYSIFYDGNDGTFFNPANPAPAPPNLANGGTPFADGELAVGPHFIPTLNDGLYGNSNSWISDAATPNFGGVDLPGTDVFVVSSIAWGRDNGNNVTDACGGQCTDRSLGVYNLQRTLVPDPNEFTPVTGNAATGWESIGTFDYQSNDDAVVGGLFTSYFRHEYDLLLNGSPVPATGVRIDVPGGGIGAGGTAIDEIEIFGSLQPAAVPEPSTFLMAGMALAGLMMVALRRRTRRLG